MILTQAILIFHQRLIIPTLLGAIAVGILGITLGLPVIKVIGTSYILCGPLFHYFHYELGNESEYYFYFNLGLSRTILWISTILFSLIVGTVILNI